MKIQKEIPVYSFKDLPQVKDFMFERITKYSNYPIKKTIINNEICLVKVEGEKSIIQERYDKLKKLFSLNIMGVELFEDSDTKMTGCIVDWIEDTVNLDYVDKGWWLIEENLKELVKISVFDGIIGNQGRWRRNILVNSKGIIIPIDDADSEMNPKRWVKFPREQRFLMYKTVGVWFYDWINEIKKNDINEFTDRLYAINNFQKLDKIVSETINQLMF